MKITLILLIGDDEDIKNLVNLCFKLKVGWTMINTSNDKKSISLAEIEQPDVILLDVMMSKFDEMQILKQLQKNLRTNQIPVILIAPKVSASDRHKFYKAGAKGVINKPFDSSTLTSQISGFLGW